MFVLTRFRADRRGVAATEFALILPALLAIWVGMNELSHATDEWRKLTRLARTISDVTSQGAPTNPISEAKMKDILASAPLVMRPFDTSAVKIRVSAMGLLLTKSAQFPVVCSSYSNGKIAPRPVGVAKDLTLPPGYPIVGARYVLTEVSVDYTPMIGSAILKLITGADTITLPASIPWPTRGGEFYNSNPYSEVIVPGTVKKSCDGTDPSKS